MSERNPHLVFLNAAHPCLANDYAFQEMLGEYFHVPITAIHDALIPADIHPLLKDEFCTDLPSLYQTLQQFEDLDGNRLPQLAQNGARVIILMQDERCYPEVLMAFGVLVAGFAGTWPDIFCIHSSEEKGSEWQLIHHLQPDTLLTIVHTRENTANASSANSI